jgi:hypothetical protein
MQNFIYQYLDGTIECNIFDLAPQALDRNRLRRILMTVVADLTKRAREILISSYQLRGSIGCSIEQRVGARWDIGRCTWPRRATS